ncbi:MAG: glycosyltransferase [Bacillales bacterium]|nr:glycosyltransferase [Bacillales bacterium]
MLISVVMSVYNESINWIKESVESIVTQSYKNIEFIIVVDNPTINQECLEYLQKVKNCDDRVRLIFNDRNIGLALSLNKGIESARGELIARMDADDISFSDRLEKELLFMQSLNADMVSTNAIIIDENSREIRKMDSKKEDPTDDLPFTNNILHPSVLIKKKVLTEVGCYRNFRRSQDYDLWLRLLSENKTIRILNEPLLKYRINQNSLTLTNRLEQYYTNVYQSNLYFERKKMGFDSYSEESFDNYIQSKKITKQKNKKCIVCMQHLSKAKSLKERKNVLFIFELLFAFLCFPSIVIRSIKKNLGRGIV